MNIFMKQTHNSLVVANMEGSGRVKRLKRERGKV